MLLFHPLLLENSTRLRLTKINILLKFIEEFINKLQITNNVYTSSIFATILLVYHYKCLTLVTTKISSSKTS